MSASASGLLLDTHAFIWWATDDERISPGARSAIADPGTEVLLSAVTGWEIAIKAALGRLELSEPPRALVHAQIARNGYRPLDVTLEHALGVAELPPHHDDPFDRLLVSQARAEGLALVSRDSPFARYDVPVLW